MLAPFAGAEAPGAWSLSANAYPVATNGTSCDTDGSYMYCVGGATFDYTAPILGATIGPWTSATNYPNGIAGPSCAISGTFIYCVGGGSGGSDTNKVYSASVSGGVIGPWSLSPNLYPSTIIGASCTISADLFMYCFGGEESGVSLSPFTRTASVSSGSIGPWSTTTSDPTQGVLGVRCGISGVYIYCAGGFNTIVSEDTVYSAMIASGAVVGAWTLSANTLPTPESYQGCTVASGYMYCVGGTTNNGVNLIPSTIYAPLSGGTVGPWTTSPNNYPISVEGASCVNSGGYIYCVGGLTTGFSDTANVYYSQIAGSLSATTTSVSCLPASFPVGGSSTCTATVTGSSPTGTVTFTQAGAGSVTFSSGGVCNLVADSCFVTATGATAGAVTVKATYGGDGSNSGSFGTDPVTVTAAFPPPPTPICPSTVGGVYMPVGSTYTDTFGNTWVAPGGSIGGGTLSSYFFVGPMSSIPPPMMMGWAGVYGTYSGQMGWIITFFCA